MHTMLESIFAIKISRVLKPIFHYLIDFVKFGQNLAKYGSFVTKFGRILAKCSHHCLLITQ